MIVASCDCAGWYETNNNGALYMYATRSGNGSRMDRFLLTHTYPSGTPNLVLFKETPGDKKVDEMPRLCEVGGGACDK